MKILVTGGAGFIASNLVDKLISHEHEIFEAVRDALGLDVKPIYDKKRPGEIDHICLDSTKVAEQEQLNWKPKVTLQEGIKLTTNFYKNRR
jgi:nucleoside-diphosphate-sugar epimerase